MVQPRRRHQPRHGGFSKKPALSQKGVLESCDRRLCGFVHHSKSKSSSLSLYFMMLRLILEESTQVTKSSRFLPKC